MESIDVACALIANNRKMLACQRKADSDHPLEWEFPGGKVEKGETFRECIIREIKEELAITVSVIKSLEPVVYDYGFKSIRLIPFFCVIEKGLPVAIEHKLIKWQLIDDFEKLKWSAADYQLFYLNQKEIECLLR